MRQALPVPVATPAAMRALGAQLAERLKPGDLVLLVGELGAGKTVLAQGIGAGLGVAERVTSPTFVLAHVHRDGRIPFVHVDAYRLGSLAEIDDLDLDTDLPASVTVVEWGEGRAEALSADRLVVRIDRADDDVRTVTFSGEGPRWARVSLDSLRGE